MTGNGWEQSADAWIASMGQAGDRGREFVLDPAMRARLEGRVFNEALDVGCGEGRFCRLLAARGVRATGIDPTGPLLARARELDPGGTYLEASAEKLPFPDGCFDLVVTYLTLIDIPDFRGAISEMARVLTPGGTLLAANLTGFQSGRVEDGWQQGDGGELKFFALDHYYEERSSWEEWAGIRIKNWHRPLSGYMQAYLEQGLLLRYFDEPKPVGNYGDLFDKYLRVPWFNLMEWQKPL